jgi:hypothetical protein
VSKDQPVGIDQPVPSRVGKGESTRNESGVAEFLRSANDAFERGQWAEALHVIGSVYSVDPENREAKELELRTLDAQKQVEASRGPTPPSGVGDVTVSQTEPVNAPDRARSEDTHKPESLTSYRGMLRRAWADGRPNNEERAMLALVRRSFGLSDEDHIALEREVQLEAYAEALRSALKAGIVNRNDPTSNQNFREIYGVKKEDHLRIEATIMKEFKQQHRTS